MATSTQLTDLINKQPDPMVAMFKMWRNTRYLVAQEPAVASYNKTKPGYYNGKVVIPGPKYDKKVSSGLGFKTTNINDFQQMMSRHYIRFIDNRTTDNAEDSVRKALYTIMTDAEADAYEASLKKYYDNRRKTVSG